MNTKELRQLTLDALRSRVDDLRAQVTQLTFSQYQRKEKNVKKLRMLRHDIARVLTVLTEREKTPSSRTPS